MKRSIEGKKLFNSEDNFGLPLQENKLFDEKKLILGNNETREIKLPDSMMERNFVNDRNENTKKGIFVPVVSFSQTKTIKKEKEEKCVLI